MSSSSLYARIALLVPAGERLFLSFPIDAAVTSYEFSGDPRLLPEGGKPWDQVRTFSIGTQARYRFDQHWAVIAGANVASAGVRGASFGDTLSGGGTLGVAYSFSQKLTLGAILTAQSKLAGGLLVLPPGGGCLALFANEDIKPSSNSGGSVALEVEDLDALIARLKDKDVQFKAEMIHSPVCRMSVILDSEGNSIILHELKKK